MEKSEFYPYNQLSSKKLEKMLKSEKQDEKTKRVIEKLLAKRRIIGDDTRTVTLVPYADFIRIDKNENIIEFMRRKEIPSYLNKILDDNIGSSVVLENEIYVRIK